MPCTDGSSVPAPTQYSRGRGGRWTTTVTARAGLPEAAGVLRRRGTGSAAEVGNWGRTAEEEEDGGVAVARERLEVSCWAGHAFFFLFLPVSIVQPIARMSEHFLFFSFPAIVCE